MPAVSVGRWGARMSDPAIRLLLAIIGLSIMLRGGLAVILDAQGLVGPGTADQVSYHTLALRILGGSGFSFDRQWWPLTAAEAPTAHWSYLYTFFLAAVYALLGPHTLAARLIQALIAGALLPYLTYRIGKRVAGGPVGLAAAALTAVYAYFAYYAGTLMTESFYITGILASMYISMLIVDRIRRGKDQPETPGLYKLSLTLGVTLGATVLLRQVYLLFIPFLLAWMLWAGRKRAWVSVLLIGSVTLAFILPFSLYNYQRFGRLVLLNTNAGFAFFWANHPIYGTSFEPILPEEMGSYQGLIPDELRGLDEAALDQELLRRGLKFVADDPIRYLRLSLSRLPVYFIFWPSAESSALSNIGRTLSFGLFLPFMAYGLVRAWLKRGIAALGAPVGLLTLFIMIYSAIHLLSWALIRYRLPVDAVLVIFAGYGLVDLARRAGVVRKQPATQPA